MKTKFFSFALALGLVLVFLNTAQASVVQLTYNFDAPTVEKGFEDYDVVAILGLHKVGSLGLPVLPFKTARILIPYGEELEDIEFIPGKKVLLGVDFFIEPGQASVPPCLNLSINRTLPDETVYNSTDEFPCRIYSLPSMQELCGYNILFLNLYPVQYVPKTGELSYYENMTVIVNTKEQAPKEGLDFYRGMPEDRARTLDIIDNPEEITSYDIQKVKSAGKATSIVDPADSYDYVIITTEALNSSGGTYTFQDLVNWKNQKGVRATIISEDIVIYIENHFNNINEIVPICYS